MIFRTLVVENFRQYYGRQHLTFSADDKNNVTLIYGSNGSGKTGLLNAFTWGLYGKTTPALEDPENLISERAWAEAKPGQEVSARVTIEFEDDGATYTVDRVRTARKLDDGRAVITREGEPTLHFVDASGEDERDNPEGAINQILPERLHRFFFFDGERDIERLVKPDAFGEIEDAIKTVLGLEIIERAILDLQAARKELNKELSQVGSAEDRELTAQIESLEQQKAAAEAEVAEVKTNIGHRTRELEDINDALEKIEEVRELQERRQELEDAQLECSRRIGAAREALNRAVDRDGFLAFTSGLAVKTLEMFEERRARGEIPSDIKLQFVQDLLENAKCICGTHLAEGSKEYAAVEQYLETAGDSAVDDSWIRLSAQAKHLFQRRDDHYSYLHETNQELTDAQREHRRYEEKLSEIDVSIKESDSDEGRQLEEKRNRLKQDLDDDRKRLWNLERDIEHFERERRDAQSALEKVQAQNEKADVARRRVTTARSAESIFSAILELRTAEVRADIDRRVKEVYERISYKPYSPSLSSDFRLSLSKTIGGEELNVSKSTGESQILSLSFVGAVAERARKRYEESQAAGPGSAGLLTFQGGIFPIVLDAPFGTLDKRYQELVAEALPQLAPQVIVFASQEQGFNAVREKLWPVAGRHAVIVSHTTKAGSEEFVELPQGRKPYIDVVKGEFEWSEVVEAD